MKYSFWLILSALFIESCVVSKPDADTVDTPDYNQRVEIRGAHYKRRATVVGVTSVVVSAAVGGYLGYGQNWVMRQEGDIRQPVKPANAAIGAFAGFAVTNLTLHILGKNKMKTCDDANKWLKKTNPNYLIYQKQWETQFTAIPRSAEGSYTAYNLGDAEGFYRTFPNSSRKEEIFKQAIPGVNRTEIIKLMVMAPESRHTAEAKLRYCELSTSVAQVMEAKSNYPDVIFPFEERAASLCANFADLDLFRTGFGATSQYNDLIFEKLYAGLSFNDLLRLIEYYPNAAKVKTAKALAVANCPDMATLERLKKLWYKDLKKEMHDKGAALVLANSSSAKNNLETYQDLFPKSPWLHPSGDTLYLGGWENINPEGAGVRIIGGDQFEFGTFAEGKLEGFGKWFNLDRVYEGSFKNGQFHGWGKLTVSSSYTYEGEFQNSNRHGKGKSCGRQALDYFALECSCDGGCYDGEWADDYPNGTGKWESNDKATWYVGGYKYGWFDGKGEVRMPDFPRVVGNFKEGQPNGKMVLKVWTLLGLIHDEQTVIAYSWDEVNPGIAQLANRWNNKFDSAGNDGGGHSYASPSSGCIKDSHEVENYDEQTFNFSGKDYTPASSNLLYEIKCENGHDGLLVFLSYDTSAEAWSTNFDFEKGWYYYVRSWAGDEKHGPYKTLEEAKKETCDCD